MKPIFGRYNTLRNQILINYLFAMVIVLLFVGVMTYIIVLGLITDKAESQMQQRAIEATGRMESLYQQINNLSMQVATNSKVQQLLVQNKMGSNPSFRDRQLLMDEINKLQTYFSGISSVELYTKGYEKLIPLDDVYLSSRIPLEIIEEAEMLEGGLVWIGKDPYNPGYFLAIRQISLLDQSFSRGGYLLIQVNPNYFELTNSRKSVTQDDYTILLDRNNNPITSNYPKDIDSVINNDEGIIPINGSDFMVVKQKSRLTGWTLVIITPVNSLMEGVSVLRTATLLSGILGLFLFLIISYSLSTIITRPIFKLTRVMKQRGTGELSLSTENTSTIEINELNKTYNQMVEEINHLIQEVYEKELIRSRTELKALQSQINPHFLFNTLNAIYWSLEKNGDEELAELIITMSELFRYTIDTNNKAEWVTIKQEVNHIDDYMKIMKFRLDRFTWTIDVPEEYENIRIPKLLLQPIVENAIMHGISNIIGEGVIKITIEKSPTSNYLVCRVTDNGKGMDSEEVIKLKNTINLGNVTDTTGTGIGIANVNKRLKLYYYNHDISGIEIKSEVNKGTSFTFEIPLNGGTDNVAEKDDFDC